MAEAALPETSRETATAGPRIVVIFSRLGPYHHARLAAVHARHRRLHVVEIARSDDTYAWEIEPADRPYPITTLFADKRESQATRFLARRMAAALDEIGPDVVCIPGWSSPAALAALDWCAGAGVPAVLMSASTAGDRRRHWWKEAVKHRVVRLYSAALVGGTPHVDYAEQLGLPRGAVMTGYDAVDNEHFRAGAESARADARELRQRHSLPERYFLASSRFIEKKNLFGLLDAYARYAREASREPWSLVLLGDGALRTRLEAHVRSLGLGARVHFPGFRQYDELPVYYGLASAFVHASTSEQWGLVVNEAMAAGLPVLVSTACGCARDLVRDGVNGHTFDPLDEERLGRLMLSVAEGDWDLAAMAAAGRRIIADWSPDRFASGLIAAVEFALSRAPREARIADRMLLGALCRR